MQINQRGPFTRGTTTGLNWVGRFAEQVLEPGDEVVISIMEHLTRISLLGQEACKKTGAKLVYAYFERWPIGYGRFGQQDY